MSAALSIIIPAFDAEETVGQTVRSALAQTGAAVEVIVVDDGSHDGTARAARVAGPVTLLRQRNAGLAGARNAGLSLARAPLVTFLDADDCVDPDFARTMIEAAAGHDLAACLTRMVGAHLEDLNWIIRPAPGDLTLEGLAAFNPLAIGSIVWRRGALERLGLLPAREHELFERRWSCHEDWNLLRRCVHAGASIAPIVPRALFDYRIRPGSMSTRLREMHEVGLRIIDAGPGPGEPRHRRAWCLRSLARALAAGDPDLAGDLGAEVRELRQGEAGLFAGALEHALGLCQGRAPWDIEHGPWRARLDEACRVANVANLEPVVAGVPFNAQEVAQAILASMQPGEVPVLLGMGRRGWAMALALGTQDRLASPGPRGAQRPCPAPSEVLWIDDAPDACGPGRSRRITRADLTARHVVILTPAANESLRASLRGCTMARVLTADDLVRAGRACAVR